MTGLRMKGRQPPRRLAQASLGAVAHHRTADAFGRGEADPHKVAVVGPVARLHHHPAPGAGLRLGRGQEVGPFLQAFDLERRGVGQGGAPPPAVILGVSP
jgi:hypothetical protein